MRRLCWDFSGKLHREIAEDPAAETRLTVKKENEGGRLMNEVDLRRYRKREEAGEEAPVLKLLVVHGTTSPIDATRNYILDSLPVSTVLQRYLEEINIRPSASRYSGSFHWRMVREDGTMKAWEEWAAQIRFPTPTGDEDLEEKPECDESGSADDVSKGPDGVVEGRDTTCNAENKMERQAVCILCSLQYSCT
jgi:hypothetical protein